MGVGRSLGANIPEDFNTNLAELPAKFVMDLGLFWLFAPRFDWCLGVAVSFWGDDDPDDKWPSEKNSQLIQRLTSIVTSFDASNPVRVPVLELLDEAVHLNDARNDFAHSFIVAHNANGHLFVQKVRVTNNRRQLELQEGVAWSIAQVEEVTHRLAVWCEKWERLLAAEARQMRDK